MSKLRVRCYDTLGVLRGASPAEVRTAYRKRALLLHPDKPGGSAEEFRQLVCAFEIIASVEQRRLYDEALTREHSSDGKVLSCNAGFRAPMQDVVTHPSSKAMSGSRCKAQSQAKSRVQSKKHPQPHAAVTQQRRKPHVVTHTAMPQEAASSSRQKMTAESSQTQSRVAPDAGSPDNASAIVSSVTSNTRTETAHCTALIDTSFDVDVCIDRLLDMDPERWSQVFALYQVLQLRSLLTQAVLLLKRLHHHRRGRKAALREIGDSFQHGDISSDIVLAPAPEDVASSEVSNYRSQSNENTLMLCDVAGTSSFKQCFSERQDKEVSVPSCGLDQEIASLPLLHKSQWREIADTGTEEKPMEMESNMRRGGLVKRAERQDMTRNQGDLMDPLDLDTHVGTGNGGGPSLSGLAGRRTHFEARRIKGVDRNRGGYRAKVSLAGINVYTQLFKSLADAITSHIILVTAKAQLPKDFAQWPDNLFAEALLKFIDEVKHGQSEYDLNMKVSAYVHFWSRSCHQIFCSPSVRDVQAEDVQELIHARRKLIEADAASAEAVKTTWLQLRQNKSATRAQERAAKHAEYLDKRRQRLAAKLARKELGKARAAEKSRMRIAFAEARKRASYEAQRKRTRDRRLIRLPHALRSEIKSRVTVQRERAKEAHQAQQKQNKLQRQLRRQNQKKEREEARCQQQEVKRRRKEEALRARLLAAQGFSELPEGIVFDAATRAFFALVASSGLQAVEAPMRENVADAVSDLQQLRSAAARGGEPEMQRVLIDMEIIAFSSECPLPWAENHV